MTYFHLVKKVLCWKFQKYLCVVDPCRDSREELGRFNMGQTWREEIAHRICTGDDFLWGMLSSTFFCHCVHADSFGVLEKERTENAVCVRRRSKCHWPRSMKASVDSFLYLCNSLWYIERGWLHPSRSPGFNHIKIIVHSHIELKNEDRETSMNRH